MIDYKAKINASKERCKALKKDIEKINKRNDALEKQIESLREQLLEKQQREFITWVNANFVAIKEHVECNK